MTALVLDAGALIALDRDNRETWALLRVAADQGAIVQVPTGAIAQAWRGGPRQALLSRALAKCDEVPLDGSSARAAGLLCGVANTSDVIDASVAITAGGLARSEHVAVLTSDTEDIRRLVAALDIDISIIDT